MSLLTETCCALQQSHSVTAQQVVTTEVRLGNTVSLGVGEHGELRLEGADMLHASSGTTYLKLSVNNTPLLAALAPWNPAGSTALTFARHAVLTAVGELLDSVASVSSGPLQTSRSMYLLAMTLATAWMQAVPPGEQNGASVAGVHDTWNFDSRYGAPNGLSVTDACTWMVFTITELMPTFVPAYNSSVLLAAHRAFMGWSVAQQVDEMARVKSENGWAAYKAAWDTWYAYRESDGYNTTGAYVATAADIPNIATPLVVAGTANPPGNGQWTPLTLENGTTQKYLGYKWSSVTSTCLTHAAMSDLLRVAAPHFPTETQRAVEVEEVVNITANLSDREKIVAEVWAGGPLTYTPPGQFVWLWKDFMRRTLGANMEVDSTWAETNVQLLSLLDLTVGLFEGSRVIWSIKTTYAQSRPIQDIRHRYYGTEIATWNADAPIAAETWVPYQMSNFVSPPFGDFSSGHSYFSRLFCNCMTYWLGASIPATPTVPVTTTELTRFSPVFHSSSSTVTQPYATFVVTTGGSEIQPTVVPASPLTLTFPTWALLAEEVGMSRLYGGIHCLSAHTASVAVADTLYPLLQQSWNIVKSV